MTTTSAATMLMAIAREAGLVDYDVLSGFSATKKLARLRFPNGRPVVIQTNNKIPRIWLLPEHEAGKFSALGKREHYEAGRGRHSNLQQVREFVGHALVKVEVSTTSWPTIRAAFDSVGCRQPSCQSQPECYESHATNEMM